MSGRQVRASAFVALAAAFGVAACSGRAATKEPPPATPRLVTIVGCVAPGPERDVFVVAGRAVAGQITDRTGSTDDRVPSSQVLPGGDDDRTYTRGGTREDWASRLTPEVVGVDQRQLRAELGHRVVVTGEYTPAGSTQPLDQLRVQSIMPVADTCVGG